MEPNQLHSVQDEQFGKQIENAETTQDTAHPEITGAVAQESAVNELETELQHGSDDSYEVNEFEPHHEDTFKEELNLPEELIEEVDETDEATLNAASQDYSAFSKEELVDIASRLIKEKSIESLKTDFDAIKIQFYKKHKAEYEKLRKQFIDEGGKPEDFKPQSNILEEKLKEIFKQYKDTRSEYIKKTEAQKHDNLKQKQSIIEEIKELINGHESLNDTFHQFRELQKKWRSIGPVPQGEVNNLWESFNHNVEKFYDFIKINKELRDLDFKRNFESKLELCEKAEVLLLESSVVKAFKLLQEYHNKWREIGPTPHETRTDIWNRFKDITAKINKRHQEYFESLKKSQENNLEAKTSLCEKAEALLKNAPANMKEWDQKSEELIDLQNVWKTVGFAPKKDNTLIYQRFRAACDSFFAKKRDFYSSVKEEQNNNHQTKLDLCVQAEALKDSTEWKKSTEDLINIQKKWKETGAVPRRISDQIWKRFRSACDTFFNNKASYYSNIDSKYEENLQQKLVLVSEIENYSLNEKVEDNFNNLKEFQRRWAEIGFVPLKNKEELQNRYRKAIDKLFDSLHTDEGKRNIARFKNKIEHMPHSKKNEFIIDRERDKLIIRLKKLESDIILWENNIGFFAKSKNAEAMVREVQSKIDSAKEEIKTLEQKIKLIDSMPSE